jgi:hypothetical protein
MLREEPPAMERRRNIAAFTEDGCPFEVRRVRNPAAIIQIGIPRENAV